MKISDNLMGKLILIGLALAVLSWLAAIVLVGVLSKSVLYTVLTVIACAVFVFGAYKYLVQHSYETNNRSLYWVLMLAGLLLALWTFGRMGLLWAGLVLIVVALTPQLLERQSKMNEDRRLDAYMANRPPTDAERILRASQATTMRDYASAMGLSYIPTSGSGAGPRVTSQFATHLTCQHCSQPQAASEWPVNGDMVAMYFQKEPGRYSLKLNCPHCGKDWYVVWDQDPGPIRPLA